MKSIGSQKAMAAKILKCGKNKIWMDPNEISQLSFCFSRAKIRQEIKNGLISKKPAKVHSHFRTLERQDAKRRGRHRGLGKRKGTAEARMPSKIVWIKRIRVLRALLKAFRDSKKIDKKLYCELRKKAKGNVFKNKRVLTEHIFKKKAETARAKTLLDQAESRKRGVRSKMKSEHKKLKSSSNNHPKIVAAH